MRTRPGVPLCLFKHPSLLNLDLLLPVSNPQSQNQGLAHGEKAGARFVALQ